MRVNALHAFVLVCFVVWQVAEANEAYATAHKGKLGGTALKQYQPNPFPDAGLLSFLY
jgi:hypothetical protein